MKNLEKKTLIKNKYKHALVLDNAGGNKLST